MLDDWICGFMFLLATVAVLASPAYIALIQMSRSVSNGIDMGHRLNIYAIIATTIAVIGVAWISERCLTPPAYRICGIDCELVRVSASGPRGRWTARSVAQTLVLLGNLGIFAAR
jgi:hypothetical protein